MSETKVEKLAPVKNGGKTEKFVWTQEISSLMLIIDIPIDTNKKSVKIKFEKKKLSCSLDGKVLVEGDLSQDCDPDESYFQIESSKDKKQLLINIQKTGGFWWSCVFKGDPEIDTSKIDAPQVKMSDLDPEVRNSAEKMLIQHYTGRNIEEEMKRKEFQQKFPNFDFSGAKFN